MKWLPISTTSDEEGRDRINAAAAGQRRVLRVPGLEGGTYEARRE